jgi:hypothetical protein
MFRTARGAIAAVLGLAIAVLPVVLDQCAGSCEAHQQIAVSTPECHHAASTGTHVSPAPSPCGHNHNAATLSAAKDAAPAGRAFGVEAAIDHEAAIVFAPVAGLRVRPHSPPDSSPTLERRSLPLRV